MGWASGSMLAEDLWQAVRRYIPKEKKQKVARKIVEMFENYDCDTLDEAESLMKAAGIEPTYYDEVEDEPPVL